MIHSDPDPIITSPESECESKSGSSFLVRGQERAASQLSLTIESVEETLTLATEGTVAFGRRLRDEADEVVNRA